MNVWVCDGCHAEIPQEKEPKNCPLCGQSHRGFSQGSRKDPDPEDKKYSEIYNKIIEDLLHYDEGCEPEKPCYSLCED